MQIIKSKQNIIEKILRDKEGRLVRARFVVYENGGRIKARLVQVVYIEKKAITGKVLILPSLMSRTVLDTVLGHRMSKLVVTSPYFNKLNLYFNGSKPRAPTTH